MYHFTNIFTVYEIYYLCFGQLGFAFFTNAINKVIDWINQIMIIMLIITVPTEEYTVIITVKIKAITSY